ncbi:nodulation protein NolA [Ruminiclostridium hungatei]|uniref:Nodulation protein NolA n=1 Tax=Ruminiclostridium hungatei TaxID=48256 RepID=A0A1V4SJB7_RUMHU|nr:effector binding domain-containing protein [Ruminiclostridium hungatei]OPX43341.1 nodulation protein NolA [Ruminiclostridium hungatei]
METRLTVGQLAQKHNISARAIRHYENIGLLESSRDMESNYRIYGEDESQRLSQILLFKGMGFSLKEIAAIITSSGKKENIVNIIRNRLKNLEKKALVFNNCIEILREFLEECSRQPDDKIDSIGLLSGLISIKSLGETGQAVQETLPEKMSILSDKDLEILKLSRSEDFNALYLPFILGQEDADILENFFINHRRFFELNKVILPGGRKLNEIYNTHTIAGNIKTKIAEILLNSEGGQMTDVTYKEVVRNLFDAIVSDMEADQQDRIGQLELKLAMAVLVKGLEILDFSGKLNNENVKAVAEVLELELPQYTPEYLLKAVGEIYEKEGRVAYNVIRIVNNAVKRQVLAGLFLAMTDYDALDSRNWLLDRALDMAIKHIWSREIEVIGQPYKTLFQVIFQIALIRARSLYAPNTFILPEIMQLRERKLIGVETRTTDRDGLSGRQIPALENLYFDQGLSEHIPCRTSPGIRYGITCRHEGEYYTYITGEEVDSFEYIPDGMTAQVLPGGTYAVFPVRGGPFPYKVLEINEYAYGTWLPASEYTYDFRPYVLIGENEIIGKIGCVDSVIKVCIPVKLKEAVK